MKYLISLTLLFSIAVAQNYKVCIPSNANLCQTLDKDGSQVVCEPAESRIDCAIKLAKGTADIGVFTEEEIMLLAQQQPDDNRVVATIRDLARQEAHAFDAVAVVPSLLTGGFEGLRGGNYCHPGLDETDLRWSPRVLKAFEVEAARTNRCPDVNTDWKTAEEVEVETLNGFFAAACRPGPWSANASVDADLKNRFPQLCSLCGGSTSACSGYTIDMGTSVAGINNNNRHIQALECLRISGERAVAYAAWQHVREFFTIRSPTNTTAYSLLCPDGTLRALTNEVLSTATAPCAFVRQPWSVVVASTARSTTVLADIRTWWPNGVNTNDNSWKSILFQALVGGAQSILHYETTPISPANYTSRVRTLNNIDSTSACLSARRWCTVSSEEQTKCMWVRNAAYTLGIQPIISCQQRSNVVDCLADIRDQRADFISADSNYGYLARKLYRLSPVKLVQNSRSNPSAFSRVTALVKETSAQSEITRFENLRGKTACFPEYGGIAFVSFVRTAHERSVISSSECDYAKAVGEFFESACAPGATDSSHNLNTASTFNTTTLCTACAAANVSLNSTTFTCAADYTNSFFGNKGSLSCLANANTGVAFVETQNLAAHLTALGLQASQFRALCRNNTLAISTGINIDDNCLLAHVVDSEVLARRNDPISNSLNTLLDWLDRFFGYNAITGTQLINLEIFSPFDGVSDLLFKDSIIGLSEPSRAAEHEPAKNYIELFEHLESCTGAAPPPVGVASRNLYSVITLIVMTFGARYIIY